MRPNCDVAGLTEYCPGRQYIAQTGGHGGEEGGEDGRHTHTHTHTQTQTQTHTQTHTHSHFVTTKTEMQKRKPLTPEQML